MLGRRILNAFAVSVVRFRGIVIIGFVALTAFFGSRLPHMKVDSAPERLLASFHEKQNNQALQEFHKAFGANERVVVLVLRARNILTQTNLQYLQQLSLHFEKSQFIERAESITNLPLPRVRSESAGTAPTLDQLDVDSIDRPVKPSKKSAASVDALWALVNQNPERFPGGFPALATRMSNVLTTPVISGTKVTPSDVKELKRALANAPLVEGRLISNDHRVAALALHLKDQHGDPKKTRRAVHQIQNYLTVHPPPKGVKVLLGGMPYLRLQIVDHMRSDQLILVPLTVLVAAILLYLSLRWFVGVLLTLGVVAITVISTMGGMVVLGEPMNVLNSILPALLIIVGISEALHLTSRYREVTLREPDKLLACEDTVRHMVLPCFLAAGTTAEGLASLVTAKTELLQRFGVTAAIGVMIAFLVTITFVPAALSLVPRPKPLTRKHGRETFLQSGVVRLMGGVLRLTPWILGGTVVVLGLALYISAHVRIDHALLDQFRKSDPIYQTTRLMEEELQGIRPLEVVLSSKSGDSFTNPKVLDALGKVESWAESSPDVINATGPGDLLQDTYALIAGQPSLQHAPLESRKQVKALETLVSQGERNPLRAYASASGHHARIELRLRDVGAKETLVFIGKLEKRLDHALKPYGGVKYSLAGEAYTSSRGLEAVIHDLLSSLLTAVGVIVLLLIVLFRSLRLGLLTVPANLLPLALTMAYMVLRGIPLNASTVMIFSISIGLTVDSSIHLLSRYREETRQGLTSSQALLRAASGTGQAIVVSTMTLVMGFAVLLVSSFVPVRQFGELFAVTFLSSLVATLVVQPALLKTFGLPRRLAAAAEGEDAATT